MRSSEHESNSPKIIGQTPSKHFWDNVRDITYEFGKGTGKEDEDAMALAKQTVRNLKNTWSFFADED